MAEDNFAMGYALGQDSGGGRSGGFLGDDGLLAIVILAMIFGWGGNGFGGGFGGGGGVGAEVQRGFDTSNIVGKLDRLGDGLCDGFYAVNTSLMNGFHGVDNAICTLGYQTQNGFNTLGSQLAACCCNVERGIDGVNYNLATQVCDLKQTMNSNTRDIIDSQNCGTRAILDFLTESKIEKLQAENQALRFSASQDRQNALLTTAMTAQTNALIDRIAPYPVAAYNVPAPFAVGGFGYGYGGFGRDGGCGCGCGC